ncbi:MAG: hypothetical protein ACRC50_12285, partial [Gaiella sp.]
SVPRSAWRGWGSVIRTVWIRGDTDATARGQSKCCGGGRGMVRGVEARRLLELRLASEALLAAAVAVVVVSGAVGSTGGSSWSFAATNALLGLLGWFRPIVAGWLFVVVSGVVTAALLFGDAYMDASRLAYVGIVALCALPPLIVGGLFLAAGRVARRSGSGGDAGKVYWNSPGGAVAFFVVAALAVIYCYVLLALSGNLLG